MNPLDEVVARYDAQLSREQSVRLWALRLAVECGMKGESASFIMRKADSFTRYIEEGN